MNVALIAGWIGALTFLGRLTPQTVRLWRWRNTAGVSWLASANQVGSSLAWTIYGLGVGEVVLWLPALVALVPSTATVVLIGRPPDRRSAVIAAGWLVAVVVAWPLGGQRLLAAVIAAAIILVVAPQVRLAARTDRLDGISASTWRVALADAVLWGTYGFGTGEPMTAAYGVVLGGAALFILTRLRATRTARAVASVEAACAPAAVGTGGPAVSERSDG